MQDQVGYDDERVTGRSHRLMLSKNRRWAIPAHHYNNYVINMIIRGYCRPNADLGDIDFEIAVNRISFSMRYRIPFETFPDGSYIIYDDVIDSGCC